MHRGNILLHRKIVDWEWYNDPNAMRLFIHLLLTANWEDKKWRGNDVRRGQRITSIANLAKELCLSDKQIRIALDKLKRTSEVASKGASSFTLVTVINYDLYQDQEKIRASKGASNKANGGQTEGKRRATTKSLESLQSLEITNTELPKRKKTSDVVDLEFIEKMADLYAAVDVEAEKRKAEAWLLCNPGRKMTKRFFNGWLSRAKPAKADGDEWEDGYTFGSHPDELAFIIAGEDRIAAEKAEKAAKEAKERERDLESNKTSGDS